MGDDPRIIAQLDDRECCPWLFMISRSILVAFGPQLLLLGALGAVATSVGWRMLDQMLLPESEARTIDQRYLTAWPGSTAGPVIPKECPYTAEMKSQLGHPPADPVLSVPYRIVHPFARLLTEPTTGRQFAFYLIGGMWTLVVWAIFGGAITRIAAARLGRDDQVSMAAALNVGRSKLPAYLGAVAIPLVAIALFSIPSFLSGLLLRWDFTAALAGICYPLVLILAIPIVMVSLLLVFGWPLMWSTISVERSDSFDAMSRGFSYTFHRPWRYIGYLLLAVVLAIAGWCLVWLSSELLIQISQRCVTAVAPQARVDAIFSGEGVGGTMIEFWVTCVRAIAGGFGYASFWCVFGAIYLLLRRDVDAREFDDIPGQEDENTTYGLPDLKVGPGGLPQVAEDAAAQASDGSDSD